MALARQGDDADMSAIVPVTYASAYVIDPEVERVRMVEQIFTVLDGGKAEYVYTEAQL